MEDYSQLTEALKTDRPLAPDVALRLIEKYPFFTLPASRALLNTDLTAEQRARFLSAVALNASDAATLVTLIDRDGARFADFYPSIEKDRTPTTDNAIDTFLDTYGHGIDPREEALLERLIFNPTPDYSEVLAREAAEKNEDAFSPSEVPAEKSEQDALLDAFLSSQTAETEKESTDTVTSAPEETRRPEHHTRPSAESPLSESLAKIFIKRGRFDKAYEIIKQLSLNFPEKSIYFADQLRFLQKLMLNQSYDKKK